MRGWKRIGLIAALSLLASWGCEDETAASGDDTAAEDTSTTDDTASTDTDGDTASTDTDTASTDTDGDTAGTDTDGDTASTDTDGDTAGTDTTSTDTSTDTTSADTTSDVATDTSTAVCGDGVQEPGEACDDGNNRLDDDCPDGPGGSCQLARCGDGYVNKTGTLVAKEACDDGDNDDTNACTNACTLPATCGDSTDPDPQADLNGGEACDSGSASNSDTRSGDCSTVCRTDCTCPGCGDGVTDYALGEECDDANTRDGDGCDATCALEVGAACGNGVLEAGNNENCDDGNNDDGDGCSATCQLEPVGATCGDSTDPQPDVDVDADEACDEGAQICTDLSTSCAQDSDCPGQHTCVPANGDGCNTTCNSTNTADTFHPVGGEATLTADNTWLWWADGLNGELWRVDIDACINHHATTSTPCQDGSQGSPGCSDPCTAERVFAPVSPTDPTNNAMHLAYVATDGDTLWIGANGGPDCSPATETYIYAIDRAACESALSGGASDCNSVATIAVGTAGRGHVDGDASAARLQGVRGLTYAAGAVYFLDGSCGTLRQLNPTTGQVQTVIGDPSCPGNPTFQEGPGGVLPSAGGASLQSPRYMTSDNSGFLYIVDNFDHTISRYNVITNNLERFVGSGSGYRDGFGAGAQFARPRDVTSDGTSLYVADFNNYTIRQVDIVTGRVSTMVGVPSPGTAQSNKCDLVHGRGAQAGTGAAFTKPLEMAYHAPSGSLFFYTGGTGGAGCFGSPPCRANQVQNQIWRVR